MLNLFKNKRNSFIVSYIILSLILAPLTANNVSAQTTDKEIENAIKKYEKTVKDAKAAYDKVRIDKNATDQQKKDAKTVYSKALSAAEAELKKVTEGTSKSSTNSQSSGTNTNSQSSSNTSNIKDPIEKALADAKAAYDKSLADAKAAYDKSLADAKAAYEKAIAEIKNTSGKTTSSTTSGSGTTTTAITDEIIKAKDPVTAYNTIVAKAKAAYEKIRGSDSSTTKQRDDAKAAYDKIVTEAKVALKKARESK
ncbi:MAG: hypothetical protein DWQ18_06980 [Crenarchaeota archaeon]|nr:MAG: hypothetical protein DWQ17_02805 [Thermoproteota archaeon]RDJ32922.1 MAG: hypothetical protein DWQ18_06980 [Thermoproteota archaeon]RDJ35996.1 MAG: hypothetical protein DWQ13_08890 [Thermoproteota archaeon]RDJ38243.1 MAG: hypothetical protein DWQ19_00195 [Thermoproteota archaeon]